LLHLQFSVIPQPCMILLLTLSLTSPIIHPVAAAQCLTFCAQNTTTQQHMNIEAIVPTMQ